MKLNSLLIAAIACTMFGLASESNATPLIAVSKRSLVPVLECCAIDIVGTLTTTKRNGGQSQEQAWNSGPSTIRLSQASSRTKQHPTAPKPRQINANEISALAKGTLNFTGFYSEPGKLFTGLKHSTTRHHTSDPILIQDCSNLYQQIRSHSEVTTTGSTDFPLHISFGLISAAGTKVLDLAKEYCEYSKDEYQSSVHRWYILHSLVGPVLSIELTSSEERAGGPPYHSQHWEARDVRTGKPIEISALLEEKSLIDALRKDSIVQEFFKGVVPTSAKLNVILAKLYPNGKVNRSAFAFYQYNQAKDLVALRIAFHKDTCGLCPNRVSQLGLWVKPKQEMRKYFVEAAEKKGFYMNSTFKLRALR